MKPALLAGFGPEWNDYLPRGSKKKRDASSSLALKQYQPLLLSFPFYLFNTTMEGYKHLNTLKKARFFIFIKNNAR